MDKVRTRLKLAMEIHAQPEGKVKKREV